jgi:hypothetical protein
MANTGFPAVAGLADGHGMALTHENIFLPKSIPVRSMPAAGNLINVEPYPLPPMQAANEAPPFLPGYQMQFPRQGKRLFPSREQLIRREQNMGRTFSAALQEEFDENHPRYTARGEYEYRHGKEKDAAARNFQTARFTNQLDFPWREFEPANRENLKRRFPEKRKVTNV